MLDSNVRVVPLDPQLVLSLHFHKVLLETETFG